jgi:uncharacterized protein (TIGR02453 family)
MFQGFTAQTLDFLWGIRFHNERTWFLEHKSDYQTQLLQPMTELMTQILPELQRSCPTVELRGKVSRIYRDARRLHGRGPYKDHLWFTIGETGRDEAHRPLFFFELTPDGWSYGLGFWCATPRTMEELRRRIDEEPKEITRLARSLQKQSTFVLCGEEYARPKGTATPLLAAWYNRKNLSLCCTRKNDSPLLFSPSLADDVLEGFRFLLPTWHFLRNLPN